MKSLIDGGVILVNEDNVDFKDDDHGMVLSSEPQETRKKKASCAETCCPSVFDAVRGSSMRIVASHLADDSGRHGSARLMQNHYIRDFW